MTMTNSTSTTRDWLVTATPIALVSANCWRVELLEIQFLEGPVRARTIIAAGFVGPDGSVAWLVRNEYLVSGELVQQAFNAPPQGSTVYEAVRLVVYQICQLAGYIPADATMMEA